MKDENTMKDFNYWPIISITSHAHGVSEKIVTNLIIFDTLIMFDNTMHAASSMKKFGVRIVSYFSLQYSTNILKLFVLV